MDQETKSSLVNLVLTMVGSKLIGSSSIPQVEQLQEQEELLFLQRWNSGADGLWQLSGKQH